MAGRTLDEGHEKATKDEITVLKLLQFIGAVSGGKTVTQVALSYLMGKGEPTHMQENIRNPREILTTTQATVPQ